MLKKITIKRVNLPAKGNLSKDIEFICKSLGYSNNKKGTLSKVFKLLLKSREGLTSENISKKLSLTRGAIVHHINTLISSGIIVKEGNMYKIRNESLTQAIEEIKEEINRILDKVMKVARDIDKKLGRSYR